MPSNLSRAALLSILATLVFTLDDAVAQPRSYPQPGRILAQNMCAECNAIQSAQMQSPNPYAPSFEKIANIRGMSAPALWSMLYSSHRRMPNIILRPEETRAIVGYILTLQDTE
ncbi:MAG: cytochrome C [Pseudorhodoplanes sp.]